MDKDIKMDLVAHSFNITHYQLQALWVGIDINVNYVKHNFFYAVPQWQCLFIQIMFGTRVEDSVECNQYRIAEF